MNGDVVPIGKMLPDRLRACRIIGGDIVEGLVGKHDAPAESIVGAVALEHSHVMRGVAQLDADRGIKPGRAAAEASDFHVEFASSNRVRMPLRPDYFKLKSLTLKLFL